MLFCDMAISLITGKTAGKTAISRYLLFCNTRTYLNSGP